MNTYTVTISVLLMYIYYHGIIDHSGINFKAYWWQPWQPHCIFHDNHHQYFHVNFGFNIEYWDKVYRFFMPLLISKIIFIYLGVFSYTERIARRIVSIAKISFTDKERSWPKPQRASWKKK